MEYREIGKTKERVSAVGLGCEHLDGKPLETVRETIDAALEMGINLMDIFMPGNQVRENIGKGVEYLKAAEEYPPAKEALKHYKKSLFGAWRRR